MVIERRWKKWVFFYIPLSVFVIGTLFPFYWMLVTAIRPDAELYRSWRAVNNAPFWTLQPTLEHFRDLMAKTMFPRWLWNTFYIAVASTGISLACGLLRVRVVVERVHLRADLPVVARAQDRAGRRRVGADPGRHLLLGAADGRRAARLDPGGPRLFVLCRVLCHRPDRLGERLKETSMAQVMMKDLNKKYDEVHAVKDVNLHIRDKEFVVLVGPSGCGKSTTLRMVAGLEEITSGEISIGERVVNDLPPKDRDIAMVFQNYALYPHMTVYDNMAFGLKMRKFPKAEIAKRVHAAAESLGIQELPKRKARQPSGGQPLRGRLHRLAGHELHRGRDQGRRRAVGGDGRLPREDPTRPRRAPEVLCGAAGDGRHPAGRPAPGHRRRFLRLHGRRRRRCG